MVFDETARRRYRFGALLLITFGAAWVFANVAATVSWLGVPIGTWPVSVDYDGVVLPKADRVGYSVPFGRVIDLQRSDREAVVRLTAGSARPGANVVARYVGGAQPFELTAAPKTLHGARAITVLLRSFGALSMVAFGALLLWRRPSVPMAGLFLFSLGFSPMSQTALNAYLPADGVLAQNLLTDIFEGAGLFGIALFCEALGAGNVALRRLVALVAIAGTALGVVADVKLEVLRRPSGAVFLASQAIVAAGIALLIALLIAMYLASSERIRARAAWICLSFTIGLPLYLVAFAYDNVPFIPISLPSTVVDLLYSTIILIPAAVAYAIVRHHVMDTGVFASKGAIFAIGATWVIAEELPVIGPIVVLFGRPIAKWGQKKVTEWAARGRVQSIRALRQSARGFALADSFEDLQRAIVQSATTALGLRGAALISKQRVIEATTSYGDHAEELRLLACDPMLRDELEAGIGTLRLRRSRYATVLGSFHDDIIPLVAIAFEVPGLPFHLFLAGPHVDGSDLDDDEIEALDDFVKRGLIAHLVLTIRMIQRHIGMGGSPLSDDPG